MARARSSSNRRSMPRSAAGNSPKYDRAEYRPPMLASPWNTARKPRSVARRSSADPASVTATNRDPAASLPARWRTRSKKCACSRLVSSVVPDLLETTKSVRSRSICASKRLSWAGSVESSTRSSMPPAPSEDALQHLGTEAGSPHAEERGGNEAVPPRLIDEGFQPPHLRPVRLGDIQPAQPASLVAAGPHGGIPLPETSEKSRRRPRRRLLLHRFPQRRRCIDLARELLLGHALSTFLPLPGRTGQPATACMRCRRSSVSRTRPSLTTTW